MWLLLAEARKSQRLRRGWASFVEIQFYFGLSGFGRGLEGAGVGLLVSGGSPDSTDKGLKG